MAKFVVAITALGTRSLQQRLVEALNWLDALHKAGFIDDDTYEAWQQDGHCLSAAQGLAFDEGWSFAVTEI